MEKSFEMDFDEWEIVPNPCRHDFIDFGLGNEKGLLFSKDIDINYFSKEEKSSSLMIEEKDQDHPKLSLECKDIGVVPPPPRPLQVPTIVADSRDVASVVLFKKLKDDELFVNTGIESPKSSAKGTIMPPVEPEQLLFDTEEEDDEEEEEEEKLYKDEKNSAKEMEYVEPVEIKETQFRLKIWRRRVTGSAGALCSIGVAAATLCIFILGGRQMQKSQHQNQKNQFQICTDEEV